MDVNGEEGSTPKKIVALKVPSLFIKSSSSTTKVSDEADCAEGQSSECSDTPKRSGRPMPASAKRKLESDNPEGKVKGDDEKKDVGSTPETAAQNKSSRPMPASLKKKLEQEGLAISQSLDNGDAQSESGIRNTEANGRDVNNTEKKPSKSMPASARKKLEESKRDEESSTPPSPAFESTDSEDKSKKPMPASVRQKLELSTPEKFAIGENSPKGAGDNNSESRDSITSTESDSNKRNPAKPMPASVRKKLEQVDAVPSPSEFNSSHAESSVKVVEGCSEKKVTRPMPASARRKLEVKPESAHEDDNKVAGSTDSKDWKPDRIEAGNKDRLGSSHVHASEEGKLEGAEKLRIKEENEDSKINSDESKKESKKITISLDGIKFPTFSKPKPKPMPASARRKIEEKDEGTNEDTKLDTGHFEAESQEKPYSSSLNNEKPVQTEGRRSRRGGSHEVMALVDAKYGCQFCGAEFYSLPRKKKHELNMHIEKKERPKSDTANSNNSKKSNKKKNSKPVKYKDNKCPNCCRVIKDRKKLYKHVSRCGKSQDIPCPHCDRIFLFQNELASHVKKVHTRTCVTKTIKDQVIQNSPSSPGSAKSYGNESKSSKHSVVEKSKPMPMSVKAKLGKESGDLKHSEAREDTKDKNGPNTFKRKIADVLSNMGSRFRNFNSHLDTEDNQSDDEEPPKKKIFKPNDRVGQESIRGRPMPATVRKKLEERTKDKTTTPEADISELDDLECEVCHKMFTKFHTRKKHERNVHFITEPRGRKLPKQAPPSEPSYSEPTPESEDEPEVSYKYDFDFKSLPPGVGKCPICSKFLTRVRKHVKEVHKISEIDTKSSTSSSVSVPTKRPVPLVRPSAPKSYKIYKTSASKAKKKFATSSPTKAPILTSERLDAPNNKAHVEENPSHKKKAKDSKDEIPEEMKGDLSEHMLMRQPRKKRVINCKLCSHLFSHEEDFIMHMQFKHKELIAGVNINTIKTETQAELKTASDPSKSSSTTSISGSRSRTRSKQSESSIVEKENEKVSETWGSGSKLDFNNIMLYEQALNQEACVNISTKESKLADDARKEGARKSSEGKETNKRRSSARIRIPSPEPEPMDTYDEPDHFDDSMDVEPDPIDEIAITSTYSQKPTSPRKAGLDEMHCSTCDEVFYSYEALRKHELYIHNVKTSRMCPICGVYPTKLSRHLLAHENKTVRCSCAPCQAHFQDFSELLKHNLKLHPGPEGGALCATNKPREIREDTTTSSQTRMENRVISCKLCKKIFTSGTNARRHVRIIHAEMTDDVENYVETTDSTKKYPEAPTPESEPENKFEKISKIQVESKLNDERSTPVTRRSSRPMPASARSKMTETDDVESSSKSENESSKPKKPMPASIRAKLELAKTKELDSGNESNSRKSAVDKPKPSRPMPASIRAKMELAKAKESADSSNESNSSSKSDVSKSRPTRAMPASVRAKLEAAKQSDTSSETNSVKSAVDKHKPSRPMPASVRAKLLTEGNIAEETHTSNSDSTSTLKRSRPMPASVRAKLQKPEEEPKSPPKGDSDDDVVRIDEPIVKEANLPEVIDLEDDDDSYHGAEPEPSPPSVPTFSIADEVAEHDKAVRLAMDQNADYGVSLMYQCKLCEKQFDTHDSTRRHIRRVHREYGPDHTENLIQQVYEPETAEISRTRLRKSAINYQEEDDEDEEVYTPRGTTRRPKGRPDWNSTQEYSPAQTPKPAKFHLDDEELLFACKLCGKRMASGANVRRHIHKAHKQAVLSMPSSSDGVVELRPGETFSVDEASNIYNSVPTWGGMHEATSLAAIATPLVIVTQFECKLCGTRMDKRFGMKRHIQKGHPEVSDSAEEYILEVGRNDDQLHGSSHHDEPMNISGESDFVYNNDEGEGEICMEDMVGVGQISISTSSRIQIDQPKSVSLNRTFSTENTIGNGDDVIIAKKSKPGPASRKSASASQKIVEPAVTARAEENEDSSAEKEKDHSENEEEEESNMFQDKGSVPTGFPYHADLSSLFPALSESHGGLEAMDDIDGGMSLD